MIYLDKKSEITAAQNNLVNIKLPDGTLYENVEPRHLFPVSKPTEYITFLGEGEAEVARIKFLDDIDVKSRNVVLKSLAMYYLVPQITNVISVERQKGVLRFTVATDCGETVFLITNHNRGIRKMADGSLRFRDSNDNRYIIPKPQDLNRHSRMLLFPYL